MLASLLAGGGLQATIVLSSLISLPFVTRALGPAEYGAFATLAGMVALLAFADLGIGSALTGRLATAAVDGEMRGRVAVSTALFTTICLAVAGLAISLPLAWLLPWDRILGSEVSADSLRSGAVTAAIATSISIVGSLGQRILYGVQRGHVANQWLMVSTVMTATALIFASILDAPLFVFVSAGAGLPAVLGLVCTTWVMFRGRIVPRPSLAHVHRRELRWLTGSGKWFFVIAVFSALGYQTDLLVVSVVLGASAAGTFNVVTRLFGLVTQAVYPSLLQLWPAFAESLARGDTAWVRSRLIGGTYVSAGVAAFVGAVLVLMGQDVVAVWLTEELAPPMALLVAFAVWTAYSLGSAPMMMLLNAAGLVRTHALMAAAVGVANLPLSVYFTREFGLVGPVLGSMVAHIVLLGIPGTLICRRVLARQLALPGPGEARR